MYVTIRSETVSYANVLSKYIYSVIYLAAARENKGVVTVHAVGKIVYNLKLENSILNLISHTTCRFKRLMPNKLWSIKNISFKKFASISVVHLRGNSNFL